MIDPSGPVWELVKWLYKRAKEKYREATSNSTEFLTYDVERLLALYSNQPGRISEDIPYSEEISWLRSTWEETVTATCKISVRAERDWFSLGGSADAEISAWQGGAYSRFREKGHASGEDTTVVRLNRLDHDSSTLSLQRAKYSQQVKSNLTLDWKGEGLQNTFGTLRGLLLARYRGVLPPLDEPLLANTVGIALVLLFKAESNEYLPYLPKRAANLAVFPRAYHCTASGATQAPLTGRWEDGSLTFEDVFVSDMFTELDQEVGITAANVQDMIPVALCREYLRAGKPQLFFAGLTNLSRDELRERRIEAIKRSRRRREKEEVEKDALAPRNLGELKAALEAHPPSLETYPALHYAARYASLRLAQPVGF